LSDFSATLTCLNCDESWDDVLKDCGDEPIKDMIELMLSLWQKAGCPVCGTTEIVLQSDTCACGASRDDGIRGEASEDEPIEDTITMSYGDLEDLVSRVFYGGPAFSDDPDGDAVQAG